MERINIDPRVQRLALAVISEALSDLRGRWTPLVHRESARQFLLDRAGPWAEQRLYWLERAHPAIPPAELDAKLQERLRR